MHNLRPLQNTTPAPTWSDPALESALLRCRLEHDGRSPCVLPSYLAARREYHALLVQRGLLSPALADRMECRRAHGR